jgi:hypothetical protein
MENTTEQSISDSHSNRHSHSDSQNINHDFCEKNNCKIYNNNNNNNNDNVNINVEKCTANFCISCDLNLGYNNPRQFCRKTYCPYE